MCKFSGYQSVKGAEAEEGKEGHLFVGQCVSTPEDDMKEEA